MKNTKPYLLLIFLFAGWAGNALQAQEKVYLPFFEALNLETSYQYSITKLYKAYLEQTGRYEVILSEKRDSMALSEPLGQARESAEAMNANHFIMGALNRVGDVVVISVSLHNTADGKKTWGSLQKAYSPEDIDLLIEHLARVTGTNQKIEEEKDIYSVTDYEAKRVNTKKAVNSFGLAIGGAFPVISDGLDEEIAGGFGLVWSFDAGNLIFDILGEAYFNEVNDIYSLDIDVLYPFSRRPNTPFALAGIGWGGITVWTEDPLAYENDDFVATSGGGVMGFLGGGYILNRTSSVRLRITAKGFYGAYEVFPEATPSQPFGGIFSAAVLFGK